MFRNVLTQYTGDYFWSYICEDYSCPACHPTSKGAGERVGRGNPRHGRWRPRGGGITEDARNDLAWWVQDQTVESARGFFGVSLARLKDRLRDDRSQLEYLAGHLREEGAQARIRELVDSYSAIEGSIEEAARDLGLEAVVGESAGQPQEPEGQEGQRPQEATRQAVQGAQDALAGTVSQATEAAGQVAGRIGQVAENLPGGQLLSRTTNESGRTVQRVVDGSGNVYEITLDESNDLVDENPVGSLTDLLAEEEYQDEEGRKIRTVKDESGTIVMLHLDPDGSILELEIPPDTE
jgi:hypothetical protein